jgi:hypothetical protein
VGREGVKSHWSLPTKPEYSFIPPAQVLETTLEEKSFKKTKKKTSLFYNARRFSKENCKENDTQCTY